LTGGWRSLHGLVNHRELSQILPCAANTGPGREPCLGRRRALQSIKYYVSIGRGQFSPDTRWLLGEDFREYIRKKGMALSGCDDRPPSADANSINLGASGSNASRRRLAEALRTNLGRRKAQKRDRAKQAAPASVQDETPPGKAEQCEPARNRAITEPVPSQEDQTR
jgi:hypothetical protein